MAFLSAILQRASWGGSFLAGVSLIVVMMLVVVSVVGRFFSYSIMGSHELTQLLISVTIAFSFLYTGLKNGHVIVEVIATRLPGRIAGGAGAVVSLLSLVFWALLAWAGLDYTLGKGLAEISETLEVPYLPFRLLLALGVFLFALTYVGEAAKALKKTAGG